MTPEQRKVYARDWYLRNREGQLAKGRARIAANRAADPEKAKRTYAADKLKSHLTVKGRALSLFNAAKKRAAEKGVPFELTREWVEARLAAPCEATGIKFVFARGIGSGRRSPFAPSIDRRIPELGYVESNCRAIVWGLNAALCTWGEDALFTIIDAYRKKCY